MKLKKILALCLANLTLFSTVAFANPPEKERQEKFENYFQTECKEAKKVKDSEGKNWVQNVDKRSDMFDKINQEKYINVLEEQKLRAKHQNKFHNCNCRFASAAIAEKLTELGFENYELLVLLPTGDYHLANLFKDYKGEWVVADLFTGINSGLYSKASNQPLNQFLQSLLSQEVKTFCVKNKPLEKFKDECDQGLIDIRLFSAIYEVLLDDKPIQIPDSLRNCKQLFFLKSKTRVSHPIIDGFKNKIDQITHDYNLNYNVQEKVDNVLLARLQKDGLLFTLLPSNVFHQ